MNRTSLLTSFAAGLALLAATASQAQTPATPALPPPPKWESTAAAGLTLTRGNSQTVLGTLDLKSSKKTPVNEYFVGANATYGEDRNVKTADAMDAFGQYNRLATDRWYYGVRLDAMRDAIAGVDYRLTLAPLAGYYFIKNTNTFLSAEAGPALVYQKQGGASRGLATLRIGEKFEHKFTATAKLWQSFEILPQLDRLNRFYINAELGAESALTPKLSLRTYIQDTYYHVPAAGRQHNDAKLVTALAYKF